MSYNKIQFSATCTEITVEKAREIFAEKEDLEVFAYDESQEVDWKLESTSDLEEAITNNNVLFVENEIELCKGSIQDSANTHLMSETSSLK